MLGEITFDNFNGLSAMPQKAASAWSGSNIGSVVGCSYKPLLYVGSQQVYGTNYWFIAEQTIMTATPSKRLVTLAINEYEGNYMVIPISINPVKFSY